MEEKSKQTKSKKEKKIAFNARKQSTAFFIIIAIFLLLMAIGIIAERNLRSTYAAGPGIVTFRGAENYNLSDNGTYGGIAPKDGKCQIDEFGFMDPECARKIACICREWSTTIAGSLPDCEYPCQATALYNSQLFTNQFTNGNLYYCKANTSYANGCDVPEPQISCYTCDGGSGEPVKTINAERAAVMTGGSNCKAVSDSQCEPKPVEPTTSCYSCKLGIGKEYAYATSTSEAADKTGGTECITVSDSYCTNQTKNCYSCNTNDGQKFVNTTSVELAKKATEGTNCTIVNSSQCEIVPNNPQTGTIGIIVAWIVGISALAYSFVYYIKLKKLK